MQSYNDNRSFIDKVKWFLSLSSLLAFLSFPSVILAHRILDSQTASKYDSLLNNPQISNAIIWEDESGSTQYNNWPSEKKTQLQELLDSLEVNAPFPIENPPDLSDDCYFNQNDAWMIYITHVAHSLWLEANRKVNWRLTDFSIDELAFLLDSRTLIKYNNPGKYCFDVYNGIGRVTDWNIQFSYDFMEMHDFIKTTQDSTVYAFAYWCRKYLLHIVGSDANPDGYERLFGYRGYPLVNRILDPLPETYGHLSAGCWGTSGLFAAVMRSVNIPVIHGYSIFSMPGDKAYSHSRIELPTINRGLCHSDDLYNITCKPKGSEVPTEVMFTTLDWLGNYIDDPIQLDSSDTYVNSKYDQAMYNAGKYLLDLAVNYLTDYLLYKRAQDENEFTPPIQLENALIGPSLGGGIIVEFAKPYFSEPERQVIINQVDEELRNLGSGSWETGKQIVIERWTSPYEKDSYITSVYEYVSMDPQSFKLFQNFPNPFNTITTIQFIIPRSCLVDLKVYNLLGREIQTLAVGRYPPGQHQVTWNAVSLPSGIYLYHLKAGDFIETRKLILQK